MAHNIQSHQRTRTLLLEHYQSYPRLQAEDIFKYLFQSTFGCEHLMSDRTRALDYIKNEYTTLPEASSTQIDRLDGAFSRVPLTILRDGLSPETLAGLFFLSAQKQHGDVKVLEEKLLMAEELIESGLLPLDPVRFKEKLDAWRNMGYPAVHHSETFRAAYHPAYRVIAREYVAFLSLLSHIDQLLGNGPAIVAIEGGSASGKTTLARVIAELYDCNIFHMDDFFLRPEQRTPERFKEPGGNVDRERFLKEVLIPTHSRDSLLYRRFDCSTQELLPPIEIAPKPLTIVEGAYSMHPDLAPYYDHSVYLDIDPEYQKERILKRNTPAMAKRFFEEWIPLEQLYFSDLPIKERCSESVKIEKQSFPEG